MSSQSIKAETLVFFKNKKMKSNSQGAEFSAPHFVLLAIQDVVNAAVKKSLSKKQILQMIQESESNYKQKGRGKSSVFFYSKISSQNLLP